MEAVPSRLTNVQMLKIFSYDLPEDELLEINTILIQYFVNRVRKRAGDIWKEGGYTDELINID